MGGSGTPKFGVSKPWRLHRGTGTTLVPHPSSAWPRTHPQRGQSCHWEGVCRRDQPVLPPTSRVLWLHFASMSYLSSSTISTFSCSSLHRSWGAGKH